VLWLILPQTKGYIILYRFWIHPTLIQHEQDIDTALVQIGDQMARRSMDLGRRGIEWLHWYTVGRGQVMGVGG
jgi:hypothetical protein